MQLDCILSVFRESINTAYIYTKDAKMNNNIISYYQLSVVKHFFSFLLVVFPARTFQSVVVAELAVAAEARQALSQA